MARAKRPKILFINRVYPPQSGTSGRVLRDLAQSFARKGWQVTVVTTGTQRKKEQDGMVQVVRCAAVAKDKRGLSMVRIWAALCLGALRQPRHDIVVSLTDPPLLVTAGHFVSHVKKSKHVHWCHDLYPDLFPLMGSPVHGLRAGLLRRMSVKALKRCDKVIVVGRCMARKMTQKGIKPGQITFIPNWMDLDFFKTKTKRKGRYFSKRMIKKAVTMSGAREYKELLKDTDNPKFRVLYAGNLIQNSVLDGLLGAASVLMEERPDVEFVFVGNGTTYERLSEQKAKRHLNNIRLLPFQPFENYKDMLRSGDLHLVSMPEGAEGMMVPCKFYASLAVQRPCIFIGPEGSEIAEVIREFSAGTVLQARDSLKLVKEIKKYRDDADYWFAAHKGAEEASKVFVPKESVQAWVSRAGQLIGVLDRPARKVATKQSRRDSQKQKQAA